jgi:hypothetical protein
MQICILNIHMKMLSNMIFFIFLIGHMQLKHLMFLSFFFCFKHSKTYKKIQIHTPIFLLINPYTLQLHFFTNHQNLK